MAYTDDSKPLSKGRKWTVTAMLLLGVALLLDHLWRYNGFEFLDIMGHETYGIILILIAFILGIAYKIKNPITYFKKEWKNRFGE